MKYVFIVSNCTEQGTVSSARTTNIVRAFSRARNFPSAITVWDSYSGQVMQGNFRDSETLNKFFDVVRKGVSL